MRKFYQHKLSIIHDKYFSALACNAGHQLHNLITRTNSGVCTIVDLGCGSGQFAEIMTKNQHRVMGVDISPHMLEIATKRAPWGEFHLGSLWEFEIPSCDMVTSLGEAINYCPERKIDYRQTAKLFGHIYDRLFAGGYLVFDILTREMDPLPSHKVIVKEGVQLIVDTDFNTDSGILQRKITFESERGGEKMAETEVHQQFVFERDKIKSMLLDLDFQVQETDNYNGYEFRRGHIGFICRKPGGKS